MVLPWLFWVLPSMLSCCSANILWSGGVSSPACDCLSVGCGNSGSSVLSPAPPSLPVLGSCVLPGLKNGGQSPLPTHLWVLMGWASVMGSAGGGRIEPHPGIPALSRGLEHADYSRACGKGFPSCPSWSRGACPTALVSSCLSLGGWLRARAPGQWPCQGSAPRRAWRGCGWGSPGRTRPGRFVPGLTVPAPAPLPAASARPGGPGAKSHVAAGVSQLLPAKCGRDLAGPCCPAGAGAVLQSPHSIPWLLLQPQL